MLIGDLAATLLRFCTASLRLSFFSVQERFQRSYKFCATGALVSKVYKESPISLWPISCLVWLWNLQQVLCDFSGTDWRPIDDLSQTSGRLYCQLQQKNSLVTLTSFHHNRWKWATWGIEVVKLDRRWKLQSKFILLILVMNSFPRDKLSQKYQMRNVLAQS